MLLNLFISYWQCPLSIPKIYFICAGRLLSTYPSLRYLEALRVLQRCYEQPLACSKPREQDLAIWFYFYSSGLRP